MEPDVGGHCDDQRISERNRHKGPDSAKGEGEREEREEKIGKERVVRSYRTTIYLGNSLKFKLEDGEMQMQLRESREGRPLVVVVCLVLLCSVLFLAKLPSRTSVGWNLPKPFRVVGSSTGGRWLVGASLTEP